MLILSVPEGDDKVHKYPLLFSMADAIVISKIDLLPYAKFDIPAFLKAVKGMNRKARYFRCPAPPARASTSGPSGCAPACGSETEKGPELVRPLSDS